MGRPLRTTLYLIMLLMPVWEAAEARPIRVPDCVRNFLRLAEITQDSSVELEIPTTSAVMSLFTTPDGTLRTLFKSDEEILPWLGEEIREAYPELEDPKDLEWDALPAETQKKFIGELAKQRQLNFFSDRRVPGLVYRKKITLAFPRPTRFRGHAYGAGNQVFDATEIFGDTAIEFSSYKTLEDASGVELHVRMRGSAGDVLNDAWTLADLLTGRRPPVHEHIVAPIDIDALLRNPRLLAARITEFSRRVNLIDEMETIRRGNPVSMIRADEKSSVINFASFKRKNIRAIARYFLDGTREPLGNAAKMGWIGVHGADKYDGPTRLWGLQVRTLAPRKSDPDPIKLVDSLQYAMNSGDYGVPAERITGWLRDVVGFTKFPPLYPEARGPLKRAWNYLRRRREERRSDRNLESMVSALWYPDWIRDASQVPEYVRQFLSESELQLLPRKLNSEYQRNHAIMMLAHDWSRDPLFYDHPDLQLDIQSSQTYALKQFLRGESSVSALQYFIQKSEILHIFRQSLGLED